MIEFLDSISLRFDYSVQLLTSLSRLCDRRAADLSATISFEGVWIDGQWICGILVTKTVWNFPKLRKTTIRHSRWSFADYLLQRIPNRSQIL